MIMLTFNESTYTVPSPYEPWRKFALSECFLIGYSFVVVVVLYNL